MHTLKFNLGDLKNAMLQSQAKLYRAGFDIDGEPLKAFYSNLFDNQKGAHQAFGDKARSLVKIYHDGTEIDCANWSHSFAQDSGFYRDAQAVAEAIKQKCSVIFDQYYRFSSSTLALCQFLQTSLQGSVGCNAYLSQKDGKAYPIHRDAHHVLVFALSGIKRWRVFNASDPMIIAHHRLSSYLTDENIIESGTHYDIEMHPGDMLYIPIGQYHCVENLTNNALHITCSVSFKPALDMLDDLMQFLIRDENHTCLANPTLNKRHPVYQQPALTASEIKKSLEESFAAILDTVDDEKFLEYQQKKESNSHLKAFTKPSDGFIEDLIQCCD